MLWVTRSQRFLALSALLAAEGGLSGCQSTAAAPPVTPAGQTQAQTTTQTPDSRSTPAAASSSPLKDRLRGEDTRASAVTEAIAAYDQAARNGTTSDAARAFVEEYAAPLTQVAVQSYGALPPKTRLALINLLVSFNSAEVTPAFAVALDSYATNKQDVESAIWAAQGAAKHSGRELVAALVRVWQALDMSDKDFRRFSAHLLPALRKNAQPEWAQFLARALTAHIDRPARFDDKPAVKAYQNQLFWQASATELLGQLHATDHVRALVLVLLNPTKRDIHPNAELAVLKLGAAGLPTLQAMLEGTDEELEAAAKAAVAKPEAATYFATKLLDQLRLPASIPLLKQAWEKTDNPVTRTLIVRSLSFIPGSDLSELLKKTFTSTKLSATLPEGESALEVLAEAAANCREREALVPWLTDRVDKVKGAGGRKGDVQRALIETISKLAFSADLKRASKVAQLYGGRTGTPMFEQASALLNTCGEDLACYKARLHDTAQVTEDNAFTRTKAVLMLGMLGGNSERAELLKTLQTPSVKEFWRPALWAVEQLTPGHDEAVLSALRAALSVLPNQEPTLAQHAATERTLLRLRAR